MRRNGSRARDIVKLAARGAVRGPKQWLILDEKGTWESMADKMLDEYGDGMRAKGATEKQVDEGLALMLRLTATEAVLRDAKRRGR